MTAVTDRIVLPCDDCGQGAVERASTTPYAYCATCRRRHKEAAAKNAGHMTVEAELASCLSDQRLHIEEAVALMTMAILRHDWFLVDCALDELQGVDRLADVRRHIRAAVA